MRLIDKEILGVLECPDCRGDLQLVEHENLNNLQCLNCLRIFNINKDFIDLTPLKLKCHPLQKDEDYQNWLNYDKADPFNRWVYENSRILSFIQRSSHVIAEKISEIKRGIVLDIGVGHGQYFDLIKGDLKQYRYVFVLDLDDEALRYISGKYRDIIAIKGCAYSLPFKRGIVDKVVSMYLLEHLYYLETHFESLDYIVNLNSEILIGIPTEGSFLWNFGRNLTTACYYRKKNLNYNKIIKISHCNRAKDIMNKISGYFKIKERYFWPFVFPRYNMNLTVTAKLKKR